MLITANTKIGTIIKNNPDAIDVLIAVNKHFIKLKNPILRRILAPRVTVTEAAKIGKCSVSLILESLSKIGFEIGGNDSDPSDEPFPTAGPNSMRVYDHQMDVRASLADDTDPFNLIMKKVEEMEKGQTLLLINSFEPAPLIRILKGKGHTIYIQNVEADLVHTFITKDNNEVEKEEKANLNIDHKEHFNEVLIRYENNLVEIDVRDLEMPQPMIAILDNIDLLPAGKALYVHHKKIPVYLLPELKEKGFHHVIAKQGAEVKMIIFPYTIC